MGQWCTRRAAASGGDQAPLASDSSPESSSPVSLKSCSPTRAPTRSARSCLEPEPGGLHAVGLADVLEHLLWKLHEAFDHRLVVVVTLWGAGGEYNSSGVRGEKRRGRCEFTRA